MILQNDKNNILEKTLKKYILQSNVVTNSGKDIEKLIEIYLELHKHLLDTENEILKIKEIILASNISNIAIEELAIKVVKIKNDLKILNSSNMNILRKLRSINGK